MGQYLVTNPEGEYSNPNVLCNNNEEVAGTNLDSPLSPGERAFLLELPNKAQRKFSRTFHRTSLLSFRLLRTESVSGYLDTRRFEYSKLTLPSKAIVKRCN